MEEYRPNSHRSKDDASEKKIASVVSGKGERRMKGFIKSMLIFMAGAICGGSYVYRHFTKLDKSKSEKTVFEASGDPAASPTELSRALDEIDPLDVIEEALLKKIISEQGYSSAEIFRTVRSISVASRYGVRRCGISIDSMTNCKQCVNIRERLYIYMQQNAVSGVLVNNIIRS